MGTSFCPVWAHFRLSFAPTLQMLVPFPDAPLQPLCSWFLWVLQLLAQRLHLQSFSDHPASSAHPGTTISALVTPEHLQFILISGVRWGVRLFYSPLQCGKPVTKTIWKKKKKRPFAKNLHLLIMHLKCQLHHVLNFLLHSYLLMDWTLFLFYFIAALIIIELKCFHIW